VGRTATHRLIAGTDEYAVKERAAAALKAAMTDDPMNFEVVDAQADTVDAACQSLARFQEALLTLPFFGGRKLVHFKNCTFLADTVTGRSESVLTRWESVTDVLKKTRPADVEVVISAMGVDRRRAFFKTFSGLGEVEFFNLPDLGKFREAQAYAAQIDAIIRSRGLQADPHVAELFVELIGCDTRAVHNELEKLALFVHPETRITEQHLRAIVAVTRESIIWDFNDAVVLGQAAQAVHLLHQLLAQGESEVGICILLSGHVRLAAVGAHLLETKQLRLVKQGYGMQVEVTPKGEALLPENKKGEKPSGFRLAKVVDQARNRPAARWFQAIEMLHTTALQLVSSGGDRARILETTVVRICQL
jgi:DNA polymerase III subunit delta